MQLRRANASVAKADAEYAAARQALVLRVAEAYFDVLAANSNLEFTEAAKRAIGQQLHQTQQRFEVGLIAITDVHEAQAGYDEALAVQIVATNQLDRAREALRELTGQAHDTLALLSDKMPLLTPEPENIDDWVANALEQNLELLAAQAAVRGSEAEFKRRQAGHYPTLDIIASQDYFDTSEAIIGNDDERTYIGLQLNMPIYQGGGISSGSREARHLYTQTQQQMEQQRRATIRQARAAYLTVMAGISQVKALKQSLSSSEIALKATQAGFDVGTRTTVDVLNAQRELYRSQRDYARARYDYLLASLFLKQAAGILTETDIEQINNWLK
jgi:outer membrane protein